MSLRFTVPGEPVAWERVNPSGRTPFIPKRTRDHEATVRQWGQLAIRERKMPYPASGPFWIGATFYLGTYLTGKKRGHVRVYDCDLDNLLKLVKDALRGVVYHDDRQVRGYTPGTKKVIGCPQPHTVIYVVTEGELAAATLDAWKTLPGGEPKEAIWQARV
jgi:Holliday junction resolvase RusA-like endonuclease